MRHYDRKGEPIGVMEWAQLFADKDYQIILQTELPAGHFISTVWLGLDHRFTGDGPPLIFETMAFLKNASRGTDCVRTSTEAQALAAHDQLVKKWSVK